MKIRRAREAVRDDLTGIPFAESRLIELTTTDYGFWANKKWKFGSSNSAKPVETINWEFSLPDGSLSTSDQHVLLLEGFKTVVWGVLASHDGGKPLKTGSCGPIMVGVRELFRWLVWRGIENFAELTDSVHQAYLEVLPEIILRREEFYPGFVPEGSNFSVQHKRSAGASDASEWPEEDSELEAENSAAESMAAEDIDDSDFGSEDEGYSYAQLTLRLRTLYFISFQRRLLERRNIPCFKFSPFKGKSYGEVASKIVPHVIKRIKALPEAVALPVTSAAAHWADLKGSEMAASCQRYVVGAREDNSKLTGMAVRELEGLGFSADAIRLLPWKERTDATDNPPDSDYSLEPGTASVGVCEPSQLHVSHRVRLAMLMFRDACTLLLLFLVGMRISEVCSIRASRLKVGGLPSCIIKRESPDGLYDIYLLKGIVVKNRSRASSHEWAIGMMPRDTAELPICVKALNHLHTMWSEYYPTDAESPMFLHFSNGVGLARNPANLVGADGVTLQRGLRRFIRCFVDLSGLPDFDDYGNRLSEYRDSAGQNIRTHQGRKTFAEHVLQTRASAAEALRLHYGHMSKFILYHGYFEPAQRQLNDYERMLESATVNFFVSQVEGVAVFGNIAPAVQSFLADNNLADIHDLDKLRDSVSQLVKVHGIRVYFGEHGACLMTVAPSKSRCRVASNTESWMTTQPDFTSRSYSMCTGCDCFTAGKNHLPFWKARAASYSEAAKDPVNRVAVTRYQISVKVVKAIEARV